MTNNEFKKLTRQTWNSYPRITEEVRLELLKTYKKASELVTAEVLRAERLGLSSLTIQSKNAIIEQLDRGVAMLIPATEDAIKSGITKTIGLEDQITNAWFNSVAVEAGLKLFNMAPLNSVVREKVLTLSITRNFQDGYKLSDRVWNSASLYKTDMSRIINLGLAQGKDNIKIAKAISGYIKGGKESIVRARTYGKIKYGNGNLYSRISQTVDWRALRLVRSEEYMSLQAANVLRGQDNPGCTQKFNWVKNSFTEFDCTCNDLQAGSPYLAENIPGYPHPNCLCTIEQVLRKRADFVQDLIDWNAGKSVPYMDDWFTSKYLLTN